MLGFQGVNIVLQALFCNRQSLHLIKHLLGVDRLWQKPLSLAQCIELHVDLIDFSHLTIHFLLWRIEFVLHLCFEQNFCEKLWLQQKLLHGTPHDRLKLVREEPLRIALCRELRALQLIPSLLPRRGHSRQFCRHFHARTYPTAPCFNPSTILLISVFGVGIY